MEHCCTKSTASSERIAMSSQGKLKHGNAYESLTWRAESALTRLPQ